MRRFNLIGLLGALCMNLLCAPAWAQSFDNWQPPPRLSGPAASPGGFSFNLGDHWGKVAIIIVLAALGVYIAYRRGWLRQVWDWVREHPIVAIVLAAPLVLLLWRINFGERGEMSFVATCAVIAWVVAWLVPGDWQEWTLAAGFGLLAVLGFFIGPIDAVWWCAAVIFVAASASFQRWPKIAAGALCWTALWFAA